MARKKSITEHGYVLIWVGKDHPLADARGYAYEHRFVVSQKIDRWIKSSEPVHHIDGNRQNNDPDNLELEESIAQHLVKHRKPGSNRRFPGEDNPIILCNCGCRVALSKYDSSGRPRRFISGHNMRGRQ